MGGEVGERLKREAIYVYLQLIRAAVWQKLTQHCKAVLFRFKKKQCQIILPAISAVRMCCFRVLSTALHLAALAPPSPCKIPFVPATLDSLERERVSLSVVSDSLRPPGSSVQGISQARIVACIAISFSRGSSQPRDQTQVSHIADRCF